MVKDHMARRVARTMQNSERNITKGDAIALIQPACWLKRPRARDTPLLALLCHHVYPKRIVRVRPFDWNIQLRGQFRGVAGMIYMPMRNEDSLNVDMMFAGGGQDAVKVATRIDHRAFHHLGAPKDGTILLERRYWNDDSLDSGRFAHPLTAAVAVWSTFVAFIGTSSS